MGDAVTARPPQPPRRRRLGVQLAGCALGGPAQPGAVGLGDPFAFPFQTIESVLVLDRRTLVVANDNNYPFSAGRRPGQPDDNELIQVHLPRGPRSAPAG
jgi:hypothetical protein